MGLKDLGQLFKKKEKDPNQKKKPFSIKDIGLPKLILMLVCGIIILMPMNYNLFKKNTSTSSKVANVNKSSSSEEYTLDEEYTRTMENKLKQALSHVKEIQGEPEVMISLKSSKESVVLKDQPLEENATKEKDSTGGTRDNHSVKKDDKTVMSSDNGSSEPYVVKEKKPEIEGVLVTIEGELTPSLESEIVDAAMVFCGVPAHKVKVMN